MGNTNQKITTFLMFEGKAEEALNYYISVFAESKIDKILHNPDGTVMHATFTLKGQTFMCIDSTIQHEFTFTPSISLFVTCETAEEIDRLFEQLSLDGKVLMPLSPTPVSEKFGWVQDGFGVSWQLNLAEN
jgi:predicted 3-demethylubiquinone-9 3-methyltransferase (glyoxalase superfamily)